VLGELPRRCVGRSKTSAGAGVQPHLSKICVAANTTCDASMLKYPLRPKARSMRSCVHACRQSNNMRALSFSSLSLLFSRHTTSKHDAQRTLAQKPLPLKPLKRHHLCVVLFHFVQHGRHVQP
jgi:hypothetical protein